MNNQDFIKEVHQYIDERYKLFEEYQQIVRSILLEFDRVCTDANINFVLAFGNAIGAVRDHAQLPWDYDVDVLVSFDDKERLIEVLKTKLADDFYYSYNDNTKKYPAICLRVGKKGYTWLAFHVDVFFYTGAPDNKNEQHKVEKKIKKLRVLNNRKNYHYHKLESDSNNSLLRKFLNYISRLKFIFYRDNTLERYMCYMGRKYPVSLSKSVVTFGGAKIATYDKHIFTPQRIAVDGDMLPIPCGYEEFLNTVYKDYRSYLPIQSRFEEFYRMCSVVEKRQSIYEQQSGK